MRILLPGVGRSLFAGVPVGEKQVFRKLSIFPIMFPGVIDPYSLTLDQAIDSGGDTGVDAWDMVFLIGFRTLRDESSLHWKG